MGIDRIESMERGGRGRDGSAKRKTPHLFVMLEHRIIDSPAFADLKPAACRLLVLLIRQYDGKNNGHLHATYSWCRERGICSEHTLRDAIADLIAHGFLYRTRSHGANGAWARYALTWLPIKNRDGLFLSGYLQNGWRNWQPVQKITTPQKLQDTSGRNRSFTPQVPAETAGSTPAETADYEDIAIYGSAETGKQYRTNRERRSLAAPYCYHDLPPSLVPTGS